MALTMKTLDPPTKVNDCGAAKSRIQWKLDHQETGWVVQQITLSASIHDQNNTPYVWPDAGKPSKYWEAWYFENGSVVANNYDDIDHIYVSGFPGKTGTRAVTGEARFVPKTKSLSKLPSDFKKHLSWMSWKLPATATKPASSIWKKTATNLVHGFKVIWTCIGEKHQAQVTGSPQAGISAPHPRPVFPDGPLASIDRIEPWIRGDTNPMTVQEELLALTKLSLPSLRNAMALYIKTLSGFGAYGVEDMSRLYLINRFALNVPSRAWRPSEPRFGGWLLPPDATGPLWPFTSFLGKLRLSGVPWGYIGPTYDALGEFDYFAEAGKRPAP